MCERSDEASIEVGKSGEPLKDFLPETREVAGAADEKIFTAPTRKSIDRIPVGVAM